MKYEIKKLVCSLTFFLFLVGVIGVYFSQMMPDLTEGIEKPLPGENFYGTKVVENADVLMPAATDCLLQEYLRGFYVAYPFLFYKEVHLKEADKEKMADILQTLTGLTEEELNPDATRSPDGYVLEADGTVSFQETGLPTYTLSEDISYEEFRKLMAEVDDLIGGGSSYAAENLVSNFSRLPMTYEDALAEYEETVSPKQVGECYTRLFCDYMGIFVALLTAFAVSFYWNMDRRAKVSDIVYSRRIGSIRLVLGRICALLLCMLPAILFPYVHMMVRVNGLYPNLSIQWLRGSFLMLFWLLPEVLFVTGFVALITELFSPYLALFIQGAWWLTNLTGTGLKGDISKWTLIVRHNSLGGLSDWKNGYDNFLFNRTFYLIGGIGILVVLVLVYNRKRRGKRKFGCKSV